MKRDKKKEIFFILNDENVFIAVSLFSSVDPHCRSCLRVAIDLEPQTSLRVRLPRVRDHLQLADFHLRPLILDHLRFLQRICQNYPNFWLFQVLEFALQDDYFDVSGPQDQFGLTNSYDVYTVKRKEKKMAIILMEGTQTAAHKYLYIVKIGK